MQCVDDSQYELIKSYAISKMRNSLDSQHNDKHVIRVKNNAIKIVKILKFEKEVNMNLLKSVCLLHDLTYVVRKPNIYTYFFEGHLERRVVKRVLEEMNISKSCTRIISNAVFHHAHSFPFKRLNKNRGIYIKILQDADTLDMFNKLRSHLFFRKQKRSFLGGLRRNISIAFYEMGVTNLRKYLNYPELARYFYTIVETPGYTTVKRIIKPQMTYQYFEYGESNNKIIIFLPSYADSALMYKKLAVSLSKKYHIFALDLPMIQEKDKIQDLESLTKYLEDFITYLKLKKFSLAAFSVCGYIAINYTYKNQNTVEELLLLNSVPRFILPRFVRKIFRFVKPILLFRPLLFIYSRLNTVKLIRKLAKSPKISRYTKTRMREFYYSVFGTALNLISESLLKRFIKIKIPKKIIFFKDDTIIPWDRYQDFVEKLDCEVIVFSEGLHADKRIYWEKLKSMWLKSPKIDFQKMKIEKEE